MIPHLDEHLEFDHLREELHELERRVDALEHRTENPSVPVSMIPARATPATGGTDFMLPSAIQTVPVAGRAVLGLAGAFLLRALADSGAVPRLLAVGVALLYAAAWLVFSRRRREPNDVAGTTYGITAALILTPLLWEVTVRFNVLSPSATAAILVLFFALSSALSWSRRSESVTTVMTLATVLSALVLMVQTGDLVPFTVALLAVSCALEAFACAGHNLKMRVPAAIAADLGFWLILYTMTRPTGVPENYKAVPLDISLMLGGLLFAIYSASFIWQTATRHRTTVFDIAQFAIIFALSAGGALRLTQGRAAASLGVLCAIACAASYVSAFVRFAEPRRTHYVFASLAVALGLSACLLIFPEARLPLIWSAAGVIATLIGARVSQVTLVVHGALYLFAAELAFGLPVTIANAFAGARLENAPSVLWFTAISAVCCYAACFSAKSRQIPALASFTSGMVAAVSIGALSILMVVPRFWSDPTVSVLATARTLVICALAFAFSFTGSRTGHRELVWISYVAIALGTVKLILEDFRQSDAAALAVALVCYGAMLILTPRLSAKSSSASR